MAAQLAAPQEGLSSISAFQIIRSYCLHILHKTGVWKIMSLLTSLISEAWALSIFLATPFISFTFFLRPTRFSNTCSWLFPDILPGVVAAACFTSGSTLHFCSRNVENAQRAHGARFSSSQRWRIMLFEPRSYISIRFPVDGAVSHFFVGSQSLCFQTLDCCFDSGLWYLIKNSTVIVKPLLCFYTFYLLLILKTLGTQVGYNWFIPISTLTIWCALSSDTRKLKDRGADDPRSGQPETQRTHANVERVLQTANQQCYLEVLTRLQETARRKRPELRPDKWIYDHDTPPAHEA
jgi:hypothetical protein